MRVVATGSGRHVTDPGEHASALAPLAALVGPIEGLARAEDALASVGRLVAGTARQIVPAQGELLIDLRASTTAAAEELAGCIRAMVAAVPPVSGVTLAVEGGVTRPGLAA